jgi:hypothetical protein
MPPPFQVFVRTRFCVQRVPSVDHTLPLVDRCGRHPLHPPNAMSAPTMLIWEYFSFWTTHQALTMLIWEYFSFFRMNVPRSTEILPNQPLKACENGVLHLGGMTGTSYTCFARNEYRFASSFCVRSCAHWLSVVCKGTSAVSHHLRATSIILRATRHPSPIIGSHLHPFLIPTVNSSAPRPFRCTITRNCPLPSQHQALTTPRKGVSCIIHKNSSHEFR